jgi:hypothetical protein
VPPIGRTPAARLRRAEHGRAGVAGRAADCGVRRVLLRGAAPGGRQIVAQLFGTAEQDQRRKDDSVHKWTRSPRKQLDRQKRPAESAPFELDSARRAALWQLDRRWESPERLESPAEAETYSVPPKSCEICAAGPQDQPPLLPVRDFEPDNVGADRADADLQALADGTAVCGGLVETQGLRTILDAIAMLLDGETFVGPI